MTSKLLWSAVVAGSIAIGSTFAYANGLFPDIKVHGTEVTVSQDNVGKVTADPKSGPPHVEGQTSSPAVNDAIKKADLVAHPQDALKAAGDAISAEAKKLFEDLQKLAREKFEEWKKQYLPYLYLAAAAFVLILMLPGFIGSLFAIALVRCLDRRAARKQREVVRAAIKVIKDIGADDDTKRAA